MFLCLTGKLSPYKICLETGYLIENFVNYGILPQICWKCQNLGYNLKC